MSSSGVADAEHFERIGLIADAPSAARTRSEFALWLRRFFDLDATRLHDLVLAIYEALANTAEFAYAGAERKGTVDVQARYDPSQFKITVTVSDRGRWRRPESPRTLSRGRGIPLMHALSDHATIDATDRGTNVRMEWTNVDHRAAS